MWIPAFPRPHLCSGVPPPPKAAFFIFGLLCLRRLLMLSWNLLPSSLYLEVQALFSGSKLNKHLLSYARTSNIWRQRSSPWGDSSQIMQIRQCSSLVLKETKQVQFSVTLAVSAAPGPQPLTSFVNRFQIPKKPQWHGWVPRAKPRGAGRLSFPNMWPLVITCPLAG